MKQFSSSPAVSCFFALKCVDRGCLPYKKRCRQTGDALLVAKFNVPVQPADRCLRLYDMLKETLNKSPAAEQRIFFPSCVVSKVGNTQSIPLLKPSSGENLSLPALADLIRASLIRVIRNCLVKNQYDIAGVRLDPEKILKIHAFRKPL